MAGDFLIPFTGRGDTGVYGQNLLWRSGHVYVMDNHRAAAWCWAREVDQTKPHALFHIDRHTDCMEAHLAAWVAAFPEGLPADIQDYLNMLDPGVGVVPLFRWDNYLPIYLALNPGHVAPIYFATHRDGDMPKAVQPDELEPWELLDNLAWHVERLRVPCILNLDLDYFFCTDGEAAIRFLDDAYFDRLAAEIARLDAAGRFAVITVALTATEDLTDGWGPAEALAVRLCSALGHPLALPE
jgi:hypothetical protein